MPHGNQCDVCGWTVKPQGLYRLFKPEMKYAGPMRLALKLSEIGDSTHACGMCKQKIIGAMAPEELKDLVECEAKALNQAENNGGTVSS